MQGVAFRDQLFQRAFASLPVYTILWEDSEVDERYLGVDESSDVLAISAAGCGVASLVASRPRSIDAVDINPHHLALAAVKTRATIDVESYGEFYELCGHGRHRHAASMLRSLTASLPPWIRRYWELRAGVFRHSMYGTGLTARMLATLRRHVGIDETWLMGMVRASVEDRLREIDTLFASRIERRAVRAALESPLQLVTLGINFAQRDRLIASHDTPGLAAHMLDHLRRVVRTDLRRNWFAWHAVAGHFNHDTDDAIPPYLRRSNHERSVGSPTRLAFHNESIFARLNSAGPDTWSHFMLCDAVDWMPHAVQRALFDEVLRTARDGAILLYRSVEDASLVERHHLSHRFALLESESDAASRSDRTRQYRRVNFYRVTK